MCYSAGKDYDVLKVMEKALTENKTSEKLTLINAMTLLKVFCRHALFGIGHNTSLSEVCLSFDPRNWSCPNDGR